MDSFSDVGLGKFRENFMALLDAQDLTNSKAQMFRIIYDDCCLEGLIVSVKVRRELFRMQLSDGTETEAMDIKKIKKIELINCWNLDFDNNTSFKIYVDDLRPVPPGYIGTKSVYETIALIECIEEKGGSVECIDLDHDLGDFAWLGGDAIKILDYLVMEDKYYPIKIHTANPVGRANMERMIERYWP